MLVLDLLSNFNTGFLMMCVGYLLFGLAGVVVYSLCYLV